MEAGKASPLQPRPSGRSYDDEAVFAEYLQVAGGVGCFLRASGGSWRVQACSGAHRLPQFEGLLRPNRGAAGSARSACPLLGPTSTAR